MAENFDLIFGQNASQQYAWSDNDYQNGWETIGNIPPTAAQFDALQRRSDTKMKELNDELTPLVNANTTDNRQPSTAYSVGTIKYTPLLPTGWFLECTVAGITDTGEIVLPTTPAEKDTVVDGTVTWTIRKIGSGGDGVPVGAMLPFSANGDIPAGYLLCDGAAYSRTALPDLFAAIGTTYGAGDGSTTFNVPDLTNGAITKLLNSASSLDNSAPVYLRFTDNRGWKFVNNVSSYEDSKLGPNIQQDSSAPSYDPTSHTPNTTAFANLFDSNTALIAYLSQNQLAMRYIIKAFDGQTPDSALIDITQYAQELAGKADINGSNMVYHKDVITTSGTYTAPVTGLYKITVKGGGGGGGGGFHDSPSNAGGGGGGEGGTTITYVKMLIGESATVVIGAGGTGGAVNSVGSNGGDSVVTVDSATYTGGGGSAGKVQSSGAGGTGTINGNPGSAGPHATAGIGVAGGAGGGAGGGYSLIISTGIAGVSGGGGSGGAGEASGAFAGGNGGDGYVWFEYYTPGSN